jgi:hypothetical protein
MYLSVVSMTRDALSCAAATSFSMPIAASIGQPCGYPNQFGFHLGAVAYTRVCALHYEILAPIGAGGMGET